MAEAEAEVHNLEHCWTWWEHRKASGNEYGTNMQKLGDFKTVEDFWKFFNTIPKPSQIFYTQESGKKRLKDREVDGFSIFKKGIRPEWEDYANAQGGEIFCRNNFKEDDLDRYWEDMVLGIIGETIDSGDEVCGVRVVDKSKGDRGMYRFELWFRSQDEGIKNDLQKKLAACIGSNVVNLYRTHGQALNSLKH